MSFDKWHPFNHVPSYQFVGSPDNPRWPKDGLALAIGEFCETEPQRQAADEVAQVLRTGRALIEAVENWTAREDVHNRTEMQHALAEHSIAVLAAEKWKQRG
jgi:hypothetical protein